MFNEKSEDFLPLQIIKPFHKLGKDVDAVIGIESDTWTGSTIMLYADNKPSQVIKPYPDNMFDDLPVNCVCLKLIFTDDKQKCIKMDKEQTKAIIKSLKIQLKRIKKYEKKREKYIKKKSTNNS